MVTRGSAQGAKLPGREADPLAALFLSVGRTLPRTVLNKEQTFHFSVLWVGWHCLLVPAACNGHFNTVSHRLLWERTRYAVVRSQRLNSQGQCILCVRERESTVLYCGRTCNCLRDLYSQETEHAESCSYWPCARRALALLLPTPSRTKIITTGACSAWTGTCLLFVHGSVEPPPLINCFQSWYPWTPSEQMWEWTYSIRLDALYVPAEPRSRCGRLWEKINVISRPCQEPNHDCSNAEPVA
jgi:hypothetical protein